MGGVEGHPAAQKVAHAATDGGGEVQRSERVKKEGVMGEEEVGPAPGGILHRSG